MFEHPAMVRLCHLDQLDRSFEDPERALIHNGLAFHLRSDIRHGCNNRLNVRLADKQVYDQEPEIIMSSIQVS